MKKLLINLPVLFLVILATSCSRGTQDTGREYAPQMYHSEAYEPLSQITDKKHGDEYNSNPNNPYNMTMRMPPKNTIKRVSNSGTLKPQEDVPNAYHIHKDSFELAGKVLVNPIDSTPEVLADGKVLYGRYCQHCHGETGQGDGLVGEKYKGVPSYSKGRVKEDKAGHIFHTITFGRNRMWPHASQVSVNDRWKIVHYVQALQKQE
jgi:mono/diheme cytochrome c family protein